MGVCVCARGGAGDKAGENGGASGFNHTRRFERRAYLAGTSLVSRSSLSLAHLYIIHTHTHTHTRAHTHTHKHTHTHTH